MTSLTLQTLQDSLRQIQWSVHIRSFGRTAAQRAILTPLLAALGVKPLRVDDLTDMLRLRRGKVFAVRWDLTTGSVGFKQPVMASLLLFHLWKRRAPVDRVNTLLDGGNVNTSLALGYLAARMNVSAEHVLSRHFPEDVRTYMLRHGGSRLRLIEAPPSTLGKEREFYAFLLEWLRTSDRRRTHLCLWHAKYSGIATRWMGEAFAESWQEMPDDIVMGLGSGSTLLGYAIPLKSRFAGKPRIVVAEHALSPLVRWVPMIANLVGQKGCCNISAEYRRPLNPIPHMVLGPHYDEVNPLLPRDVLSSIGAVIRYSDAAWQQVSHDAQTVRLSVGNSSAANLAVSRHLASQGRTVFTFLYESMREFYVGKPTDAAVSKQKSSPSNVSAMSTAVPLTRAS